MITSRVFAAVASLVLVATSFAATVHGTLVDENGKPIIGALLHCNGVIRKSSGPWEEFSLTARTTADGAFQLLNAPSMPSAQSPMHLVAVLPNGHLAGVKLVANRSLATISDHSVSIKVHVVNKAGTTLAGVKVSIERLFTPWDTPQNADVFYMGDLGELCDRLAKPTDSQGNAILDGLPGGARILARAHAPGMERFTRTVDLPKEGEATLDAHLNKGAILTGKVLSGGKPVRGIKVTAWVFQSYLYNPFESLTGSAGEFRIDDAPAGKMHVDAGALIGHPELLARSIPDLNLREGDELDGLNLVLEKGVHMHGLVRTIESNKPVGGASVRVTSGSGESAFSISDTKGHFDAFVLNGPLLVSVDQINGRRIQRGPNLQVTVDALHNPILDLPIEDVWVLPAIQHLTGAVVDADGKSVSGATVLDLDSSASALSDNQGHFHFDKETHPGDHVIVTKDREVSKTAVVLTDQSSIALRLDSKLAIIKGAILDDDGLPIEGVELTLGGKGVLGSRVATSDANGDYRFDRLVSGVGDFFLWAKKSGFGNATIQPISVTAGEAQTLSFLRMTLADGVIDGKVLEPDGKPAVGVNVSSQAAGALPVKTDALGEFHMTNIPRGEHTVVAGRANFYGSPTLAKTGQTDVLIKLASPRQAIGQVQQEMSGKIAPSLKIAGWVDGKSIDIQSLRGKTVVIDFWAITCPPCVASLPKVQALADNYAKQGVVVIGVHETGTSLAKLKAFVKQKGLTYSIGLDKSDATGLGASASEYSPKGWPTVYVVSPSGRIIVESNDIEDAVKAVQKLVAKAN